MERIKTVAKEIPGYDYGSSEIAKSSFTVEEFALLKLSAQFADEEQRRLRTAVKF